MTVDHNGPSQSVGVSVPSTDENGVEPGEANTTTTDPESRFESEDHEKPMVIVVMGVAGTGKTTLARALNEELGMPYVEGDDLHPPTNIAKMSEGIALTDADREPWLHRVRNEAERVVHAQFDDLTAHETTDEHRQREEEEEEKKKPRRKGVMITCSSLKRSYRSILRGQSPTSSEHPLALPTYFVYIKEDVPILRERIGKREGHFMKAGMLDSQLATLESPEGEEGVVVVPLDASTEVQARKAREGLEALVGPLVW
ncbi:hypothetical protein EUX98_g5810 [Antrodiella citrinella]|uniref:gluconokinase n=1 Tax=Antrodiella citrinella TaxID=2447956 RepID=A0A4V3XIB5_9APHY|nr:hypothetical protein EUX98_g5810 [Antrodiella citrinella]